MNEVEMNELNSLVIVQKTQGRVGRSHVRFLSDQLEVAVRLGHL